MSTCMHGIHISEGCLKCEMGKGLDPAPLDGIVRGIIYAENERIERAIEQERARCRAIVSRLFANDWKGNQALEEIDHGGA